MDRKSGEQPRGSLRGAGARVLSGLAWSLCALAVSLAAGSLILGHLNGRTASELLVDEGIVGIALLTVAFSVVGTMVASYRPENAIGWVFCAAALFQGLSICGYEYATYALLTDPGSLPLGAPASWLGNWVWAPGLGLILVFLPLLFPDGRLPSRRWRPVAWLGVLSVGTITVSSLVLLWPARGAALLRGPAGGEGIPQWTYLLLVEAIAFPLMLLAGLGAVLSLFLRFRRARGEERQQIKWFAYATAVSLLYVFLLEGIPDFSRLFEAVTTVLGLFVIPSIPVATGIAIFRYHLYDIDLLINRTLVYGTLTGVLVAVYVGGVVLLQALFRSLTGGESTLVVVASTLVIASLFSPLRRVIQAFIDRRFYRKRYDAAKTLAAFSTRLRDETDLDALGGDLVSVLEETVQPEHVSVWLQPTDTEHEAVAEERER